MRSFLLIFLFLALSHSRAFCTEFNHLPTLLKSESMSYLDVPQLLKTLGTSHKMDKIILTLLRDIAIKSIQESLVSLDSQAEKIQRRPINEFEWFAFTGQLGKVDKQKDCRQTWVRLSKGTICLERELKNVTLPEILSQFIPNLNEFNRSEKYDLPTMDAMHALLTYGYTLPNRRYVGFSDGIKMPEFCCRTLQAGWTPVFHFDTTGITSVDPFGPGGKIVYDEFCKASRIDPQVLESYRTVWNQLLSEVDSGVTGFRLIERRLKAVRRRRAKRTS